jgi:hypothetical protein
VSNGTKVNMSWLAGLGILLTLNLVLFIACFLGVRFSTVRDPISGATLGIVIWSTYFLILIGVSYSAVSSVISWIFGSLATKLRQLIEALTTWIQGGEEPRSQILTEEAMTNFIHQEIQTSLDKFDLRQHFEDYVTKIKPSQLYLTKICQLFADLITESNLDNWSNNNQFPHLDRQNFINLNVINYELPTHLVIHSVSMAANWSKCW